MTWDLASSSGIHIVYAREITVQTYVHGKVTIGTRRVSKRDIGH